LNIEEELEVSCGIRDWSWGARKIHLHSSKRGPVCRRLGQTGGCWRLVTRGGGKVAG